MDDPDFVKNNKKMIVPIEQYLSDLVAIIEDMKAKKNERMDSIPPKIMDFFENHKKVNDTFKDTIDSEKSQVSGIFKDTIEQIVDCFVDAGNSIKNTL